MLWKSCSLYECRARADVISTLITASSLARMSDPNLSLRENEDTTDRNQKFCLNISDSIKLP